MNIHEMNTDQLESLHGDLLEKAVLDIFAFINETHGNALIGQQCYFQENMSLIKQSKLKTGDYEKSEVLIKG